MYYFSDNLFDRKYKPANIAMETYASFGEMNLIKDFEKLK